MAQAAMKLQLYKDELALLIKYHRDVERVGRSGGFQGLTRLVYNNTNIETGEMELSDDQLGRCLRYMISYGAGGFQDSFLRPVFRRLLKL
jgi:hypothetical protein